LSRQAYVFFLAILCTFCLQKTHADDTELNTATGMMKRSPFYRYASIGRIFKRLISTALTAPMPLKALSIICIFSKQKGFKKVNKLNLSE
ncbi:hypothetical protein, partial [Heyndrickxia coagulans]|uniref:hypothetical protein n=5 Tax=Heyndrickxia coagulans TaxID=1398 RepID=UPI001C2C0243